MIRVKYEHCALAIGCAVNGGSIATPCDVTPSISPRTYPTEAMAHPISVQGQSVIVGAGPVGLALALGLARHGVRTVVVEKNESTSKYSRAPGIHLRTLEVFRQWSVANRFLLAGVLREKLAIYSSSEGAVPLLDVDFSALASEADRPGLLVLEQGETEALLLEAVRKTGMSDIRFGTEATALHADEKSVRLTVRAGDAEEILEAPFLVGCDGAGSFVRNALALPFEGKTYSTRPMLADIRIDDDRDSKPWPRIHNSSAGITLGIKLRDGLWRLIRLEPDTNSGAEEVPDSEIAARMEEVVGPGQFETVWASRFRIHLRSAPTFRVGRVLLAGDAAHIHSPVGGQGMNVGIQDAHNLAWKLAAALRGGDIDRLLDSYNQERHEVVVGNISRTTDIATRMFLQAPSRVRSGVIKVARLAMNVAPLRRRNLRQITMIDLGYEKSALINPRERAAGERLPNTLLRRESGAEARLYDLLPIGPCIIDCAQDRAFLPHLPIQDIIRIGPGEFSDASGLLRKLLGNRDGWILVRPDAHIAFARHHLRGAEAAVKHALGERP